MKITFIGTGAGEGYPGHWCDCPNCAYAREKGGKNIRGNTCTLIDDDVTVDLNVHLYAMAPRLNIHPGKIRLALITHTHKDHFNPQWLLQRAVPAQLQSIAPKDMIHHSSPNFTALPTLHIYGNSFVEQAIFSDEKIVDRKSACNFEYHPIKDGEEVNFDDVFFIPVRSYHTEQAGFAHNYIISRGGKTILYASDTGGYDPEMLDIILSHKYDLIIMEGTFGLGDGSKNHMNLDKNRSIKEKFLQADVWKDEPRFYLTHMSPHWTPPHDIYAPMMEKEGFHVAWDGLTIEI